MTALSTTPRPRLPFGTEEVQFIKRSIIFTLRTPEVMVMAIALPVMLMLLFTFVFGGAIDSGGDYVNYVVPGIILLCAGFGASSIAVDVAKDLHTGIIERFRTMRIRSWAVLTGHVVSSLVRNLVATAVVIGVALAVGFRPVGSPTEWLAAIGVIALWILSITYLYAAIGLAAGSEGAASGYGFALLFLPYISSAFVPVSTLPSWLQWVAQHQPVTPIVETIRGLLMHTPLGNEPLYAVIWCAVILLIAVAWGTIMFRRKAGRR
ncbi:MAG: ABC transporter permease [Rhodoglobus sp.]